MSAEGAILVGAAAILIVTVLSGRLDKIWFTEPLLISILGVVVGQFLAEPLALDSPAVLMILEITLALVLFSDASRIEMARLRSGYSWPLRMLVIGMPIVIVLGTVLSGWYLSLPFGLALLLGVILAPTDAALAAPVLESEIVPGRVRQAINVESGLNDGLAVPALLIAIGIIESETGTSARQALGLVVSQLGIGIVGGLALGWLGSWLIGRGKDRGGLSPENQKIAALALAVAGYTGVQLLGGSGFVATFIAGGLMSHLLRSRQERPYGFVEAEGHTLVLLAFFIFGLGPASRLIAGGVAFEALVVALVSLVVLRPLSIALSLAGQKLSGRTIVFLGWFGPRGLATIVFLLVALEELGALDPLIVDTLTVTVALSIVLHGLSGVPMSRWLASMEMDESMPEMGEAYAHPMRY
jgi:NhaP-type Na+/H+ or K+/H+ antiporter